MKVSSQFSGCGTRHAMKAAPEAAPARKAQRRASICNFIETTEIERGHVGATFATWHVDRMQDRLISPGDQEFRAENGVLRSRKRLESPWHRLKGINVTLHSNFNIRRDTPDLMADIP